MAKEAELELPFEDLFQSDDVNDEEITSPPAVEDSPLSEVEKGVSALTLTIRTEEGVPTKDELGIKWAALQSPSHHPIRLGSSAPVKIPQRNDSWGNDRYERLGNINEDETANIQRTVTFIPPHLTIEQPVIQFSLNSNLEGRRALLQTRERVLSIRGFGNPPDRQPSHLDFRSSDRRLISNPPAV